MKAKIVLLFMLATTLGLNAQIVPKVQVGIRAGANFANFGGLKNAQLTNNTASTLVMGGIFAQVTVFKKFGIRTELLFNPKGAVLTYIDANNIKYETKRKINSADATLSLLYNFKVAKVLGMYAFAGYSYESLTSVKDVVKTTITVNNTVTSAFEKNAQSIIGGVGFRFHIKKLHFSPEIRYLFGITDLEKGSTVLKNRVLTASIGVGYSL